MRVAAAACLVSSGLIAWATSGAVAVAEPEGSGDGSGAGAARPTTGESSGRPGRSAPTASRTVTGPRSAISGPHSPARTPWPVEVAGTQFDSKLSQREPEAVEAPPEDVASEPVADPAGIEETGEDIVDEPGEDGAGDGEEPDDECGGWWPFPPDLGLPASADGGGYDGGTLAVALPPGPPAGLDTAPLPELLPENPVVPVVPDALDPPAALVAAPVVALPAIVLPPVVPGIGEGGTGAHSRGSAGSDGDREPPVTPGAPAERPARSGDADVAVPASYRAGYREYLRTADIRQVAAVAVPGATAIMLLTGAGGVIGYRQARAGHAIRAGAAGRFSS
ncbi:hypothetical protein V4U86_00855 [Mycobacterium sp. AMU20-3851]|uniref:hypothetical protein n=1 Tax=Mycobacterium sp. AMU20-3851 TaxID=3122055 RepID=UPI003753EB03